MAAVEHDPVVLSLLDDDEDTLSFRGFPIHESEPEAGDDDRPCRSSSSLHEMFEIRTDLNLKQQTSSSPGGMVELFEFRTDLKQQTSSSPGGNGIVFCGKIMDGVTLDSTLQSRGRGFVSSSESFMRNQSFRFGSESRSFSSPAAGGFGYQRNNSRRPKALIGLTRTPSRMELSEIRKRQARLAPVPMFYVVPAEEPVAVTVAADVSGGGIRPWSLLRHLRYRSVLVRVLAKAASSCITHA